MKYPLKILLAISLFLVGFAAFVGFSPQPLWQQAQAQQQKKVALVIGNKDYRYDPLANTLNDARDMSAKLKSLGFSVALRENLSDEKAMKRAVREVLEQIQPGDIFLFYYSGHAMDVKGINYLLPTQAEINKEVDVEYEALNFNLVLDEIEAARGKANIVILDSCRNNPFIQRAGKSANKGLAIPRSPSDTYIIYATSPGQVASDNPSGRNGLFTQSLLESLSQPGLTHDQIFRFTARKVRDASNGKQVPWAGGSIIDEFYFNPPRGGTPASPAPVSAPPTLIASPSPLPVRPNVSLPKYSIAEQRTIPLEDTPVGRVSNSLGMEFVYIPPGTFLMGSPESEEGRFERETQHRVTLSQGYYLQTTEVTQGQWQAVMGNNPSYFKGDSNLPVEQVSWEEVQIFIAALNRRGEGSYRLPTEAEWEYAARSGSSTRYSLGDSETSLDYAGWYVDNSGWKTHPVGQKQPNGWGLYDMHGNVWEWVQDWYGNYPGSAVKDPKGPGSGSARVNRGGGWYDDARYARSAYRDNYSPGIRSGYLGFRLVRGH